MASLTQLLAHHDRILVLDAASTVVQIGLLQAGQPARWHSSQAEAGRSVFVGTNLLLAQAGRRLDDISAFAYCEGPGSMLGTRTVAMTLRTWTTLQTRPVYAYQSLALAARHVWVGQPRACTIIADARRETWHVQAIDAGGKLAAMQRAPTAALPPGERFMPEHFRTWSEPPSPTGTCSYDLAALLAACPTDDLFSLSPVPDAFQHEAPAYKKWSARPHSAESAPPR